MKKHTVIETLDSFGEEFDTEKLIEKLLFVEKVEKGLKDVEEGKVHDSMKSIVSKNSIKKLSVIAGFILL
jgi:hypothetical protein